MNCLRISMIFGVLCRSWVGNDVSEIAKDRSDVQRYHVSNTQCISNANLFTFLL